MDTPGSWTGATVSHYRILEQLGGGGMGVVYRAVDENLDRPVALKFLPPAVSHLDEVKERFIREAKAASALDHPNICTIYEIDATGDGQLFIAMAYHPGETLKQRIARGPLQVSETVEIMRQIAGGLAESHDHDIIHRDVKPANIWVRQSAGGRPSRVKILDFGLAKVTSKADLTRTCSSMGTPAYMSPEHARGERVDPRTDLWSLGVLSYEALTRQVPFTGGSIPAIMYALLAHEPRPLRDLRPEVPPELERIVAQLMRKQACERYASCYQLLADLERVPVPPSPSPFEVDAAVEAALAIGVESGPRPTGSRDTGLRETLPRQPVPRPVAVPSPPAPPVGLTRSPSPAHAQGETLRMPRPAAAFRRPLLRVVPPPAAAVSRPPPSPDRQGFERQLERGLEAALARSYELAMAAFEKALELRPGDPRAQFNLERVRRQLAGRSEPRRDG